MELTGEQLIQAPRPKVWAAINDPEILARCVPGCEEITAASDTELNARVMLKIGPVRARFNGRLLMSDIDAPASCKMRFEGTGGAAGFASGESAITLIEEGEATRLRYTVSAKVGGKLGQIGGRLIDASSKKLADEFFTALNCLLSPGGATETTPQGSASTVAPAPSTPSAATPPSATPLAPTHAAAQIGVAYPPTLFPAGWSGELARVLWFVLGVGSTLLGTYLLR